MQAYPSITTRARSLAKAPRTRTIFWWIVGLITTFAVIGFLVAPPIAKSKLEEELSKALRRTVTVETVRINPFVPSLTVRGFAVRERQGNTVFASFDELHVNVAWSSIFRLAPVVDEITLAKPHLRLVRNADRTYNFQDLLEEFLARPKSDGPTPQFALFNIQLLDGQVDFDDQVEKEKHALSELRIGMPFISSLPAHVKIKVLPELAARVNGAPLGVKGETLPFENTHVTTLNINLDAFDLTRLVDYLPFELRAELRSALIDARLVVAFEQPPGKIPKITLRGGTALRRLNLLDPQGRPMLAWQRLGVEINDIEPLASRIELKSIELEGANVELRRDKTGAINLAQIVALSRDAPQAPPRDDSAQTLNPLVLKSERVTLKSGRLHYTDQMIAPGFETTLDDVQIDGRNIDYAKDKRSEWTLAAHGDAGETFKIAVGATAQPLAAGGRLDVAGLKLKRYQPYLNSVANVEVDDGQLDLGVVFKWAGGATVKKQELKIADLALVLKTLRLRLKKEKAPFVRLTSFEMKRGSADFTAQTANLGESAVREMVASLRREKSGRLNVESIVQAKPQSTPAATSDARPWRIDLGEFSIERGALALEDLAVGEPVRVNVAAIRLKAQKLSTAKGQRGNISLHATIDKRGTLAVSGPLTLDPLAGTLRVDAHTIGFVPVQRYIDDKFNVAITSGALSGKGTASFAKPPRGAIKLSYKGDLSVTDFASVDKRLTEDLLKWKSLSLGAIDFNLQPMKASVDEIALADFYARIILSAEGRLNLQDFAAKPGDAPGTAPQTTALKPGTAAPVVAGARPAEAQVKAALPPNLRIGRITLQSGNVNFSDYFIKPNYTANLTGIGGSVTEMTPEKAGDVELRGKVDNAAPVEILGSVNPLATDLFLDVKASAKDIELSPLAPYAVKYAGYGITRGKLSMSVKYKIEHRKLAAENNIYLDQLTFGERVESATATKLPVTLAVALLKDRNGVIDINLPISGSLDDPQFSLGGIIIKVIVNLIVKAITAPFALIGSLFGGGEELAYLEFAPGLATLGDGAIPGKLANLAKALTERPGLKLDIAGRVDPEADREGLKRASIDRKVRAQKFKDLRHEGEAPVSANAVRVESVEYSKYLKRAYGDEKFPKPRNVIGLVKDLPLPEMENLMLTHTQVTEDDLRVLANARAQAAKDWLMNEGNVGAERIFIVTPRLTAEGIKDKGKPTRADFALK